MVHRLTHVSYIPIARIMRAKNVVSLNLFVDDLMYHPCTDRRVSGDSGERGRIRLDTTIIKYITPLIFLKNFNYSSYFKKYELSFILL
jgi:hypothetical protein